MATNRKPTAPARRTLSASKSTRGRKAGVVSAITTERFALLDSLIGDESNEVEVYRPGKDDGPEVLAYVGYELPDTFVQGARKGLSGIVATWAKERGITKQLHSEMVDGVKHHMLEIK